MDESITKALHDAQFLCVDIREAHSAATEESPLAEIILMELIADAEAIRQKINRLSDAISRTR